MNSLNESLIMIVDDNLENLQVLGNMIDSLGCDIVEADSGHAALTLLETMTPDLILLDVLMPGMNGFEVCQEIKNNKNKEKIPIIFLTALNQKEYIIQGFKLNAVDYITKPFFREELIARIKNHLSNKFYIDEKLRELQQSYDDLSKAKSALNNLLEMQQANKISTDELILENIKNHICPHIDALRATNLNTRQQALVEICERNFKQLIFPIFHDEYKFYGFTPKEYTLCDLILKGYTTKEIANILGIAINTVNTHRENIRAKLGKTNLAIPLRKLLKQIMRKN